MKTPSASGASVSDASVSDASVIYLAGININPCIQRMIAYSYSVDSSTISLPTTSHYRKCHIANIQRP